VVQREHMGNPKETLGQSQGQKIGPEVQVSAEAAHGDISPTQPPVIDLGSGEIKIDPLTASATGQVEAPVVKPKEASNQSQSQGQGQKIGPEVQVSIDTTHVDFPAQLTPSTTGQVEAPVIQPKQSSGRRR